MGGEKENGKGKRKKKGRKKNIYTPTSLHGLQQTESPCKAPVSKLEANLALLMDLGGKKKAGPPPFAVCEEDKATHYCTDCDCTTKKKTTSMTIALRTSTARNKASLTSRSGSIVHLCLLRMVLHIWLVQVSALLRNLQHFNLRDVRCL